MAFKHTFLAVAALSGALLASPAFANGGSGGKGGYGSSNGGFMCGGKDGNGCSVSPVTKSACLKDLRGDTKELKCDLVDLIVDILNGKNPKSIYYDIKEIKQDLAEIAFDLDVLKGLKKK